MKADKGAAPSALDFHRTTYADAAMLSDWVMLPVDQWPDEWFTYNQKTFPRLESLVLPEPAEPPAGLGAQWLAHRVSSRTALAEMSLADLSQVLWYTTHSEPPEQHTPATGTGRTPRRAGAWGASSTSSRRTSPAWNRASTATAWPATS